jgi:hypothetical protein
MISTPRRDLLASLFLLLGAPGAECAESEWIPLSSGRSLDDGKASGNHHSLRVQGDRLVAAESPAHLFYTGRVRSQSFKSFGLKAEALTRPSARGLDDVIWPAVPRTQVSALFPACSRGDAFLSMGEEP